MMKIDKPIGGRRFLRLALLVVCLMAVARPASAQSTITLNMVQQPLSSVLRAIQNQSPYTFVYNNSLINVEQFVTIRADSEEIDLVLENLLRDTQITYKIIDRQITLSPRTAPAGQGSSAAAQQPGREILVSGVVTGTNDPLAGVVVLLKGTNRHTITDAKGEYQILVPANATLTFSYLGMEELEISVGGRSRLPITLQPSIIAMQDVVVTGYQTISRERATGSYGTVSGAEIADKLRPDLKSALEGQVAGLSIDKDGKIEIRGVSTFSASQSPLIVVDGFPIETTMNDTYLGTEGTLENINPDNVESVTVLKDGVAASIYGSRAANGVIVIQTKRGTAGEARVSYKGSFGFSPRPNLNNLKKASTDDYIDAEIDYFNQNPTGSEYTSTTGTLSRVSYLLRQASLGNISETEAMNEINSLRGNNYLKELQKEFFRPKLSHQHNLSVSGGTENHNYNVSVNLLQTRENFIHTNSNRIILDIKDEWKLNKFITAGASVNVVYSKNYIPRLHPEYPTGDTDETRNLTTFARTGYFAPYTKIYDDNGQPASLWGLNPNKINTYENYAGMKSSEYDLANDINRERIKAVDFQSRVTGFLRFKIIEGLTAELGGNWQRGSYVRKETRDAEAFAVRIAYNDATSATKVGTNYLPEGGIAEERRNVNQNWTVRAQFNFLRNFDGDRHRVSAIAGMEIRRLTYDNNTMPTRAGYNPTAGTSVPVNVVDYNSTAYANDMLFGRRITLKYGSYGYMDNRFVSWYGNGSYEFDNRYIVSASIRLDLTNIFGTNSKNRYKPLWSIGGTWKLSQEKFFDVSWIDRLYLRGSFGINGNISLTQGPYMILSAGQYNNTTGGVSYDISSPANKTLRWEKTKTSNIGLDLGLLNNRLNITLDYYLKKGTDLLAPDQVDQTTGFSSVTRNLGAITNRGLEITIGALVINNDNFRWFINHNFAFNKSKVDEYNATRMYTTNYTWAAGGGIHVAGYPANGLWGNRFAGLDNTGKSLAYNKDGDIIPLGTVTVDDMVYLGSTRPKFDLSLTNRFSYKNWDLSFMIVSKLGHKFRKDVFNGNNIQSRHVSKRWRQPGDEAHTIYPVLDRNSTEWWAYPFVDAHIGNASYAKLRDITLSYNFGKNITNKLGIGSARVYLQARNLFYITASGTDIDPETFEHNPSSGASSNTDWGFSGLPIPREIFVGVQVTF